jgi:hypothetical protein
LDPLIKRKLAETILRTVSARAVPKQLKLIELDRT